ncbi:hypothetical protein OPIT5_29395 [Opitutaceae bacterium TAV5]|nr:hypothetical protein OPIT5_21725 [Opitutaceae bacterium TAV5]AHF94894.1 hypothetical protein OPIT5_29395 [Opitutaceae bacterium TAV5]
MKKTRPRVRWMVTINGLPARETTLHIPSIGRWPHVFVLCELPPVDATTWAGKHGKRDARRAAERTRRFNRYVRGKTALAGDWFLRGASPRLAIFVSPVTVDIAPVSTLTPAETT